MQEQYITACYYTTKKTSRQVTIWSLLYKNKEERLRRNALNKYPSLVFKKNENLFRFPYTVVIFCIHTDLDIVLRLRIFVAHADYRLDVA